ncbi:MAG: hypothetical protein ACE15E_08445 [Acidobacteriota bacterium]
MKTYLFHVGVLLGLLGSIWDPVSAEQKPLGDWQNVASLKPGDRVAVYLKTGGKIAEAFQAYDAGRIVLRSGPIEREKISVVSLPARDTLKNGALMGAASGFAVLAAVSAPVDDFAEGVWVILGAAGAAGGSGIGALLDAGMATPEKVIYACEPQTKAITARRWKLTVASEDVFNWIWNRKVDLMLKDGTYLRGQVERGDQHNITMRVEDSSTDALKGVQQILSTSISTVVYREKLNGSRVAAVIGGAFAGLFLGAIAGLATSDAANEGPRAAGGGIAGGLAGTMTGLGLSELNWREITLVVRPTPGLSNAVPMMH